MNSILLTDSYKLGHREQYPEGTTLVFSNLTPRSDNHAAEAFKGGVIVFGVQLALKQLQEHFDKYFFRTEYRFPKEYIDSLEGFRKTMILNKNETIKAEVIAEIKSYLNPFTQTDFDTSAFEDLWDLGYLPIEVRALDEGTYCPMKVPMLTIHNTLPEFFWITNYLETIISNLLWKPMTSATIAHAYKKLLVNWAKKTNPEGLEFVNWQGHDFSMRGMDSIEAVVASGLGHLTSFYGSDSLPTLWGARYYYNEGESFVVGSVPATEHSVMSAGSKEGELETFQRLLKIYPTGIVSVVSDTWDLWNVITNILPQLKDEIVSRDGKLVIRPDSGDPVDILCGLQHVYNIVDTQVEKIKDLGLNAENIMNHSESEKKGVIELLWDIFGGTTNEQGYKVLDSHIGAIYGDSITVERAEEICRRLEAKGFASTNVVLGIGSFTYQYNTRDTFGFAVKATYIEKNGDGIEIFKDPVTDSGLKKSAKGLLKVLKTVDTNEYFLVDKCTWEDVEADDNELKIVFKNGEFLKETTMTEIRECVNKL